MLKNGQWFPVTTVERVNCLAAPPLPFTVSPGPFRAISTHHPQGCCASALHNLPPPPKLLCPLTLPCLGPGYPSAESIHLSSSGQLHHQAPGQPSLSRSFHGSGSLGSVIAPPLGSSFLTAFHYLHPHHSLLPSL